MNTTSKLIPSNASFEAICDWSIVFFLCAAIFTLPASIAILDSCAGAAILFYLLKKISRISSGRSPLTGKSFCPPVNVLNLPLQLLTFCIFVSVVFSHYPGLSLVAFIGKFLKCVFLYFAFIEAFTDERRIRIFLSVLLLSAFVTSLSGLYQHYTGRDFLKGHRIGTENYVSTHRINSSFLGANGFGAYLLPVIAFVAHFFYREITRRKWVLVSVLGGLLAILLVCLCWTYSRSSWLGYLMILLVMFLLDMRKWLFSGLLLLIFIFFFLPSLNHVRNLDLINDNSSGARIQNESLLNNIRPALGDMGSGRFTYWKKAITIVEASPVWGAGLNTYTKMIRLNSDPSTWHYAHNSYLQMAAETGLAGLISFLWMLFVLLRQGLKKCFQIKDECTLSILRGGVCGLFGLMVQSFFDNTFYTVQLSVLLWIVIGLIVGTMRLEPDALKRI